MVSEKDAIGIFAHAEEHGVGVWLDGGWGVDALLEQQTRVHNDIDLFVEARDARRYAGLLQRAGYGEVKTDYTTDAHTVWADGSERIIDLHVFEFRDDGSIDFDGNTYPAEVLGGIGRIGGRSVRCIPPAEQVAFHLGYDFDDNDVHDVRLLCDRFQIPVPPEYMP